MKEVRIEDVKGILAAVYNRGGLDRVLNSEDIEDDDLLFDYEGIGVDNLEFDSLDALEMAACLEDEYDIVIANEVDPERISSPRRILKFLSELVQETA